MDKYTLRRGNESSNGKKIRSSRLLDPPYEDNKASVQLSGALLLPDPEDAPLFQIKLWSLTAEGPRWTEFAVDETHNLVAQTHFHDREQKAWDGLDRILRRKGYL